MYNHGMTEQREWYTVAEAAAILRVTQVTLRAWLRAGRLKGRKIHATWLVPASEVLPQQETQTT